MQGYLLPIVLAGLLAVPLFWRIGSDVTVEPATLAESPDTDSQDPASPSAETQAAAAEDYAVDKAEDDSRKIRSFSLGDGEVRLEFTTVEELLDQERERLRDLRNVGFDDAETD